MHVIQKQKNQNDSKLTVNSIQKDFVMLTMSEHSHRIPTQLKLIRTTIYIKLKYISVPGAGMSSKWIIGHRRVFVIILVCDIATTGFVPPSIWKSRQSQSGIKVDETLT